MTPASRTFHATSARSPWLLRIALLTLLLAACGEGESAVAGLDARAGEPAGLDAPAAPPDDTVITPAPDLVGADEDLGCTESCESLGSTCGVVCGEACGDCADGEHCVEGLCLCEPYCDLGSCGESDGCDGECPPCPAKLSCEDCPLQLELVETTLVDGLVREILLAVDVATSEAPTMADLRFLVDGPARVASVGVTATVMDAGKELVLDPNSGSPFRDLGDGVGQVLIFSSESAEPIPSGRWLYLKLRVGAQTADDDDWMTRPVQVRMVEREEIFAPPLADQALWNAGYANPVVVWTDGSEVTHED